MTAKKTKKFGWLLKRTVTGVVRYEGFCDFYNTVVDVGSDVYRTRQEARNDKGVYDRIVKVELDEESNAVKIIPGR